MSYIHIPVMIGQVIRHLDCRPGGVYVDCTLGGAGHSLAILERILPGGMLIGLDRDVDALENAKRKLARFSDHIRLIAGNFRDLAVHLEDLQIQAVDGIVADLGLSRHHLEGSGRGFSFNRDEPLDMRMGPDAETTAGELIATFEAEDLARIFREYGEERWSKKIARSIVRHRAQADIQTSRQLAQVVEAAVPKFGGEAARRIHPATRVFMALRIAVNQELRNVTALMEQAPRCLKSGGRLCVISFHSLEDRIVKHQMRESENSCTCPPRFPQCICGQKPILRVMTRKPERPSESEIAANPMARSAKLRAAEKL
jgi:16S rRNA (cytosine1402-N4)-methyltransferase